MKNTCTQKILMAELSMTGVFHAGVNAGFVRLMRRVYPEAELRFFAERSHIRACRQRLSGERIRFRGFPFFPRAVKWTLPLRDCLGCLYAVWLFLCSRKRDILFITNLLPLTHASVFLLNGLFRRRLYIALHGQLDALLPGSTLRLTKPYLRLHGLMLRCDRRSFHVLLGQPIHDAVRHLFPKPSHLVVIDHPYDEALENPEPVWEYPLRLGQIGVGNRGKGTGNLFRLGELLCREIESGLVELRLIGRLDPELRREANPWVGWHSRPLDDGDFTAEIERLHYTLLLRNDRTCRAVASGSFFDGVKYGKPFLSLDNGFVRHYAERFPRCGEIFPSVEAMAEAIRQMCRRMNPDEYRLRAGKLKQVREELSIPKIAGQFKRQTE